LHERFVAAFPAAAKILDLGCGSGSPVARYLVERGHSVTGVDSSSTLISLCRQRLPEQDWLVGDMRALMLDRRFDGVLAWDSFFHLAPGDQRAMFAVFAQHAAPSAMLMFNSGPSHGEAIGEYRGDTLYHASLSAEEYKALLGSIGFLIVAHTVEDWQTGGGRAVWLARAHVNRAR
jgi:trans-aconitate methyltransferase